MENKLSVRCTSCFLISRVRQVGSYGIPHPLENFGAIRYLFRQEYLISWILETRELSTRNHGRPRWNQDHKRSFCFPWQRFRIEITTLCPPIFLSLDVQRSDSSISKECLVIVDASDECTSDELFLTQFLSNIVFIVQGFLFTVVIFIFSYKVFKMFRVYYITSSIDSIISSFLSSFL